MLELEAVVAVVAVVVLSNDRSSWCIGLLLQHLVKAFYFTVVCSCTYYYILKRDSLLCRLLTNVEELRREERRLGSSLSMLHQREEAVKQRELDLIEVCSLHMYLGTVRRI